MKYHSTKKSVLTITVIISILLIISTIGIFKFQAETPVQALSTALLSNLEMPNGYSIKVENVNESFLVRQKIDKISLTKNDNPLITISDLTVNQNLFNYIGNIVFKKPLNFDINAKNITIDMTSDFSNLLTSLSSIKVKENTIAIQSKLEKTDINVETDSINIRELLNLIIQQQYIDLSPVLGTSVTKNAFNITIDEGLINYLNGDILLKSKINNLNIEIAEKGLLNKFDFQLSDLDYDDSKIALESDMSIIEYQDNKINFLFSNTTFAYLENNFDITSLNISYNLVNTGQVLFNISNLKYFNNEVLLSISKLTSQLKTNFKDFSLFLNPTDLNLNIGDDYIKFNKANLGLSSVKDNLSLFFNSEDTTSIYIDNNLIDIFDLDISFFSEDRIFNKSNIKIGSIEFNQEQLYSKVSSLAVKINAETNSEPLLTDGKLDFSKITYQTLKDAYKNINITLSSALNVSNNEHKLNSTFNSIVDIQDNFNNITVSLISDNLYIDDLEQAIAVDINLQGPIEFAEGQIKAIEANFLYGDNLIIKAVGSVEESLSSNHIKTSVIFDDFNVNEFSTYILGFIPSIKNYVDEDTLFKGSINYDGNIALNKDEKFNGELNSSILLKNAKFLDSSYNLGFNLDTQILDEYFNIKELSLSLFNFRLAFDGKFIMDSKSLSGSLNLEDIEAAQKILNVDFENDEIDSTNFILTVVKLPQFSLVGSFKNMSNSMYQVTSLLNLNSEAIDFYIDADIKNLIFNVISKKGLQLDLSVKDTINANLSLDNFTLIDLDNSSLNGKLDFNFKNVDLWSFEIEDFDFAYNNKLYDILLNGEITQNTINLNQFDYYNNKYGNKYSGTLFYEGPKYVQLFKNKLKDEYKFNLTFGDNISQRIETAIFNDSGISNIFLDVSKFNISRLFANNNEILLNARIIGSTDFASNNEIKGKIEFNETGNLNTLSRETIVDDTVLGPIKNNTSISLFSRVVSLIPFINLPSNIEEPSIALDLPLEQSQISFSTNLNIEGNNYLLENLNLNFKNINFENTKLNFNSDNFDLLFVSTLSMLKPSVVTNQKSSFDVDLYVNFISLINSLKNQFSVQEINFNTLSDIYKKLQQYKSFDYSLLDNINGHLNIENFDLFKDTVDFEKLWESKVDEELNIKDINSTFNILDGKVILTAPTVNANIDLVTKTGEMSVSEELGLGGDFIFDYNNQQFDIVASNLNIPISLVEKLVYIKLIKFYGDNLTGDLMVKDLFNHAKLYGQINTRSFKIKTLYTTNNEVEIPNLTMIFDDDRIYTNRIKARYFDIENNEHINFYSTVEVIFDNFIFKNFNVDVECPNYLPVYVPLVDMNLAIDVKAKNYFTYSTDGLTSYISGDLIVKDAVVRSGVSLPAWIISRQETNGDFKITTADNNSFYYPQLDNPILSLTMSKNQTFEFKFDSLTKSYFAEGTVDVLQGEIFYFQKNFYIDTGSLSLRLNPDTNKLEPIISLEATLREIDDQGDSVDILMSLKNNTLDNLSPVFSSIPTKSQKDIMNILGQSFSSSNPNETNTVASIATAATSVFSSLGYIDTGGVSTLNKTIASTLNLDFFSLKSNIVENIILETFIEDPRYSSFSPLARYLNNTTIFMGKYLTTNSKLQIMINLLASNDSNATSFLSSDLALDFEMSYEIDTELAKFSFFTNPAQLSILEILDTIGFSVTKTIHFR